MKNGTSFVTIGTSILTTRTSFDGSASLRGRVLMQASVEERGFVLSNLRFFETGCHEPTNASERASGGSLNSVESVPTQA
jgi:hypothetical protein